MAKLSLRVDLDPGGRIGPGKIALLETIAAFGSISAGARALRMSYKRAWDLVEEMNALFGRPVVAAKTGGRRGGGAELTPLGLSLVTRYRAIETAALAAAKPQIEALEAELGESPKPIECN
ncbi:MAG: winged helix-turn-helix domain-containing protein [Fulvimarina manganoxydans]|uniref:winged helix-turn-helix domain-containing protein n=1 Tax=Fulvimarina manganoxydans TaxID=937218 RepID=UPI002357B241|nr:winged helix-turn-helix domain-containing protein [Fulvimarina manganoxydans]MCK5931547.1 winged helix-turn-helix domain-containing protein [Fulvimarina manganoxydans]